MHPLAAALLVTLHFTAPSFDAGPDCADSISPLDDLAEIRIYAMKQYDTQETLLMTIPAVGMEGQPMTADISLEPGDALWTVSVTAVDDNGNESCQSSIGFNQVVDVPKEGQPPEGTVWFDVAGRKYHQRPRGAGIYVEVHGKSKKKIVILN